MPAYGIPVECSGVGRSSCSAWVCVCMCVFVCVCVRVEVSHRIEKPNDRSSLDFAEAITIRASRSRRKSPTASRRDFRAPSYAAAVASETLPDLPLLPRT